MVLDFLLLLVSLLATGIEAAYVPSEEGGGEYLVRVEPDLVRSASPYQFTSDVPADARDVRRVRIYVADNWPPAVERSVIEAASRPRKPLEKREEALVSGAGATPAANRPWPWLIGSLIALFMSLGANAYLGMLLGNMRQRYQRDIEEGFVKA